MHRNATGRSNLFDFIGSLCTAINLESAFIFSGQDSDRGVQHSAVALEEKFLESNFHNTGVIDVARNAVERHTSVSTEF